MSANEFTRPIMGSDPFVRKVRRTMHQQQLLGRGERVLAAVSGGADSVALLMSLHALAREWALEIVVAHLDHGIRPTSGAVDRPFVERLATNLGHAFVAERIEVKPGGNLEARARRTRYTFLERVAREKACHRIATGHTLNDQAETLLLRLLRGAGSLGLAAMRPRAGRIVRPLLECSRREVEDFLTRNSVTWIEDESNADDRFDRNRVRQSVIPVLTAHAGRDVLARLARTAQLLSADDELLEELATEHLARRMRADGSLEIGQLSRLPAALRWRLLREWLRMMRGSLRGIALVHVRRLDEALLATESRTFDLPGGCVRAEGGALTWLKGPPPPTFTFEAPMAPGTRLRRPDLGWEMALSEPTPWDGLSSAVTSEWTALFDAALLPQQLVIRTARRGDRIRPIGVAGTQKLQDVFTNAKVPRTERQTFPLLASPAEVLWLPGLRRSVVGMVGDHTRSVVRGDFRRLS